MSDVNNDNTILNNIHTLSSCRQFTSDRIQSDHIKIILDAATEAASASNVQFYSIIVIRDKKKIVDLGGFGCDTLLLFNVDFYRYQRCISRAGYYSNPKSNMYGLMTAIVDACLAAQNAALTAHSLGIASLFSNFPFRWENIKEKLEYLNYPKYVFPVIALCLGYSKEKIIKRGRLKNRGIIHYEHYEDYSDDEIMEIINKYDEPEKNMGLPFREYFPKKYERYWDWFCSEWLRLKQTDSSESGKGEENNIDQISMLLHELEIL